jgi:sporulation protein YlmC with PRC-barrel domain
MAGAVKLRLGAKVVCSDGPAGTLTRFIIDLDTGRVTHVDVANHTHGGDHLVPIAEVAEGGDEIHLSSTSAEFSALQADQSYADIYPAASFYDPDALVQMPFIGFGGMGMFGAMGSGSVQPVREQLTPKDETGVERHEPAYASDGHHVGHIDGLIVEPTDGHITYLLLAEGHIFNKKEVAIPSDSVLGLDEEGARLSLTKDEIEALPAA